MPNVLVRPAEAKVTYKKYSTFALSSLGGLRCCETLKDLLECQKVFRAELKRIAVLKPLRMYSTCICMYI